MISVLRKTARLRRYWKIEAEPVELSTRNGCLTLSRQKKSGRPRGTATLVSGNYLDCLFLEETPCHAKRAESRAEQHDSCASIWNLAAGRPKEGNVGDVPYRIIERHCS
jgi:hypothetical protein